MLSAYITGVSSTGQKSSHDAEGFVINKNFITQERKLPERTGIARFVRAVFW